ncbi:serine/threonine-protein kinase [Lipingzhangella sp. LS1_29]|uniref:Serine/threonine-protein kinase n=1 Tax=Lipingzhangella rawalii TaxID=2055835 RepID=A0ABU2H2B9_9ACTN|nr:serine/threonine-protein kinase [Lipingzhangella rawalii]MDS1269010.1 serine/threonine-protein kinase [Lipingzhangella rawalii]
MESLASGDPERIGRYRLIGRLGSGGMGRVYFGRSAAGRPVAVKRIHAHMAADPAFRERFAREVAAARQVSGAFTAPVIDADTEGEIPWLVTSYVPSLPLDTAVRQHGPLPESTVRVLAVGLAEALTEIHRCGLIHRDLKPGNVLLAEDGPRVIDFGIARASEGTAATQSVIGTPGFMSPQQVNGEPLTARSDMFSLGAVLVYAAAGVGPFGEGAMPTMVMRIMNNPPDLSSVPPSLHGIVAACLAKEENVRPDPGQLLDTIGDVPASGSWLPPAVMQGVQHQTRQINAALAQTTDASVATAVAPGAGDEAQTFAFEASPQPDPPRPTQAMPPTAQADTEVAGGDPAYAHLYRGRPAQPQHPADTPQRTDEREHAERERRRREEERAHRRRLDAERNATRQAHRRARKASQPSLWTFAAVFPLLIIPLVQIPLGVAAAYGWAWFSASDMYWGTPWYYVGVFAWPEGLLHATMLGYFLFNNLIGLSWLFQSLRSSFVVGVVLALLVILTTNAALVHFGFW